MRMLMYDADADAGAGAGAGAGELNKHLLLLPVLTLFAPPCK
jgi:hypothetical protein